MQVWVSRHLGCSGLVVLAVLDDQAPPPAGGLAAMPVSVWLVDEATAELVAEMLHDAEETAAAAGREVRIDLDTIIAHAELATGHDRRW